MRFVEPIGLNRKFGAMGHPSRGTDRWRILSFNIESGTVGRLTIQTVKKSSKLRYSFFRSHVNL